MLRPRFGEEACADPLCQDEPLARGRIIKVDPVQRNAYGWAYITHDATGRINLDRSGEFVDDIEELERAAYDFVKTCRRGDADHNRIQSSVLIESMVFTAAKMVAIGLPIGSVSLGWWVGFHIQDPGVWSRIQCGELSCFSISGWWTATPVPDSTCPAVGTRPPTKPGVSRGSIP